MTNDELKEILDAGFSGTHGRLDAVNGRIRQNEIDIAILKDRSERGGWLGGLAGGAVTGVMLGLKAWFSK